MWRVSENPSDCRKTMQRLTHWLCSIKAANALVGEGARARGPLIAKIEMTGAIEEYPLDSVIWLPMMAGCGLTAAEKC
jgi:hypothetical protein